MSDFQGRLNCTILLVMLALAGPAPASGDLEFSPAAIADWTERVFEGRTRYEIVPADRTRAGHDALRARCSEATASGRLLEREIDLDRTPILEWRWRVDSIYEGLDERSKAGDDYPARVYVIARRWPNWRSRAINYVWSSGQPTDSSWENAFADQFMMVAVRSGATLTGQWLTERRDVRADFLELHDLDVDTVDVVAVMTDCDNAGQSATAWYGPIRWLAE